MFLINRSIVIAVITILSVPLLAEIKFVQSKDGAISEVAEGKVESLCGKNFIFRESHKEETPSYLQKEIIKAAFKGEMSPSIDTLVSALKASSGKCAWLTSDELQKVK